MLPYRGPDTSHFSCLVAPHRGMWFPRLDHLMMLVAFAHPLKEIVELGAFPLCFLHNEQPGSQLHHIQLKPLTTRGKLDRQAFFTGNMAEMLWQLDHGSTIDECTRTTNVSP